LLTAYVGDVQIMADFGDFRTNILDRFGSVLDQIGSQLKTENKTPDNAEIYIVAHSEGTVVAFMGLLRAMCEGGTPPPWFKYVRGFMTFGSPIDKHIVLWPDIWQPITNPHPDVTNYFAGAPGKSIRWRNYFDFGDPVGFALDTARDWLETHGWREVFAFPPTNDHGFARYALPGQAHNDYWKDPDVFGHFVENTMNLRSGEPRFANPPGSRPMAQIIANVTPYLLVYGLCCLGSYFVYNATGNYLRIRASSAASSILDVLGIGALLTGTIALARILKLTRRSYFWPISMSIFALCAVPYFFIRAEVQHWHAFRFFADTPHGSAFFVIAVAFVVGLISARIGRSSWNRGWKVNFRWLCAGARPLVIAATAYVALIVIYRIRSGIAAPTSSGEPPPTRPLILAGGAFLYLWWLAILIFDLVFVWHRYIRFAAAPKILRAMRNARKIAEARE
jgi:hypothetical protein